MYGERRPRDSIDNLHTNLAKGVDMKPDKNFVTEGKIMDVIF